MNIFTSITLRTTTTVAAGVAVVVGILFSIGAYAMEVSVPTPVQEAGFGIPEIIDAPNPVEAPTALQLESADMTSVIVSWAPAVFSIVPVRETYQVVVTQKVTSAVVNEQSTDSTTVTVKGLDPNTAYVVAVTRIHGETVSEPLELTVRTTPNAPKSLVVSVKRRRVLRDVISNKPLNSFGGASGSRYEALLQWDKPEGTVRYYTVVVYRKGSDEIVRSVQSKDTVAKIGGLKEGHMYEYQVIAHFNDSYASVPSERMDFEVSKDIATVTNRLKPFSRSMNATGAQLP